MASCPALVNHPAINLLATKGFEAPGLETSCHSRIPPWNPLPGVLRFLSDHALSLLPDRSPPPAPAAAAARRRSDELAGCAIPLFRPYVARVPWHCGFRGLLSQIFPRYGHYCGPNWSSGKDGGSALWDRRPIDWLDFCCYCHDMGYDTGDQVRLLKADIAFLGCLESPRLDANGDPFAALIYRSMCIAGLRYLLVPYRTQLIRFQGFPPTMEALRDFFDKALERLMSLRWC